MNTYKTKLGYVISQEIAEQIQKEVFDATGSLLSLEEVLRLVDIFKGE